MVRPAGFEPATTWFEAKHSNPLNYGRVHLVLYQMRYTIYDMKITENQPLAPYTSLNVGGNASELVEVNTYDDMVEILNNTPNLPLVLGYGCNVLISDNGISGRTLIWRDGSISLDGSQLIVDAGVWWDDAVQYAIAHDLWGLELTSEIPGSVGGATFGNIAAYGQQVSDTLAWVDIYDFSAKKITRHLTNDFEFKYRWSSLQDQKNLIILRAGFDLSNRPLHELRYESALSTATRLGITPDTLENSRKIIIETRTRAGSIYHPGDSAHEHTAGSFFKNPMVPLEQARKLATFDETGKTIERIESQNKIHGGSSHRASAAHVLLAAGYERGHSWGKVRLNPKHVLKIETLPGATADEVYLAANEIISVVKDRLGIVIEPEVKFIGFE